MVHQRHGFLFPEGRRDRDFESQRSPRFWNRSVFGMLRPPLLSYVRPRELTAIGSSPSRFADTLYVLPEFHVGRLYARQRAPPPGVVLIGVRLHSSEDRAAPPHKITKLYSSPDLGGFWNRCMDPTIHQEKAPEKSKGSLLRTEFPINFGSAFLVDILGPFLRFKSALGSSWPRTTLRRSGLTIG